MSKFISNFARKIKRELFGYQIDANGNPINSPPKKRVGAQINASEVEDDASGAEWLQLHYAEQTQLHYIEGLPPWKQRSDCYAPYYTDLSFFTFAAYPFTRNGLTEFNHAPNQPHWRVLVAPPHLQRESMLNYTWAAMEWTHVDPVDSDDDGRRLVTRMGDNRAATRGAVYRPVGVGQWALPQDKAEAWEQWRKRQEAGVELFISGASTAQQAEHTPRGRERAGAEAQRRRGFLGWLLRLGSEEDEESPEHHSRPVTPHAQTSGAPGEQRCDDEASTSTSACAWCRAAAEVAREGKRCTLSALVAKLDARAAFVGGVHEHTAVDATVQREQDPVEVGDARAVRLLAATDAESDSVAAALHTLAGEDELGGCGWALRRHVGRPPPRAGGAIVSNAVAFTPRQLAPAGDTATVHTDTGVDANVSGSTADQTDASSPVAPSARGAGDDDTAMGPLTAVAASAWGVPAPGVSLAALPLGIVGAEAWSRCSRCRERALGWVVSERGDKKSAAWGAVWWGGYGVTSMSDADDTDSDGDDECEEEESQCVEVEVDLGTQAEDEGVLGSAAWWPHENGEWRCEDNSGVDEPRASHGYREVPYVPPARRRRPSRSAAKMTNISVVNDVAESRVDSAARTADTTGATDALRADCSRADSVWVPECAAGASLAGAALQPGKLTVVRVGRSKGPCRNTTRGDGLDGWGDATTSADSNSNAAIPRSPLDTCGELLVEHTLFSEPLPLREDAHVSPAEKPASSAWVVGEEDEEALRRPERHTTIQGPQGEGSRPEAGEDGEEDQEEGEAFLKAVASHMVATDAEIAAFTHAADSAATEESREADNAVASPPVSPPPAACSQPVPPTQGGTLGAFTAALQLLGDEARARADGAAARGYGCGDPDRECTCVTERVSCDVGNDTLPCEWQREVRVARDGGLLTDRVLASAPNVALRPQSPQSTSAAASGKRGFFPRQRRQSAHAAALGEDPAEETATALPPPPPPRALENETQTTDVAASSTNSPHSCTVSPPLPLPSRRARTGEPSRLAARSRRMSLPTPRPTDTMQPLLARPPPSPLVVAVFLANNLTHATAAQLVSTVPGGDVHAAAAVSGAPVQWSLEEEDAWADRERLACAGCAAGEGCCGHGFHNMLVGRSEGCSAGPMVACVGVCDNVDACGSVCSGVGPLSERQETWLPPLSIPSTTSLPAVDTPDADAGGRARVDAGTLSWLRRADALTLASPCSSQCVRVADNSPLAALFPHSVRVAACTPTLHTGRPSTGGTAAEASPAHPSPRATVAIPVARADTHDTPVPAAAESSTQGTHAQPKEVSGGVAGDVGPCSLCLARVIHGLFLNYDAKRPCCAWRARAMQRERAQTRARRRQRQPVDGAAQDECECECRCECGPGSGIGTWLALSAEEEWDSEDVCPGYGDEDNGDGGGDDDDDEDYEDEEDAINGDGDGDVMVGDGGGGDAGGASEGGGGRSAAPDELRSEEEDVHDAGGTDATDAHARFLHGQAYECMADGEADAEAALEPLSPPMLASGLVSPLSPMSSQVALSPSTATDAAHTPRTGSLLSSSPSAPTTCASTFSYYVSSNTQPRTASPRDTLADIAAHVQPRTEVVAIGGRCVVGTQAESAGLGHLLTTPGSNRGSDDAGASLPAWSWQVDDVDTRKPRPRRYATAEPSLLTLLVRQHAISPREGVAAGTDVAGHDVDASTQVSVVATDTATPLRRLVQPVKCHTLPRLMHARECSKVDEEKKRNDEDEYDEDLWVGSAWRRRSADKCCLDRQECLGEGCFDIDTDDDECGDDTSASCQVFDKMALDCDSNICSGVADDACSYASAGYSDASDAADAEGCNASSGDSFACEDEDEEVEVVLEGKEMWDDCHIRSMGDDWSDASDAAESDSNRHVDADAEADTAVGNAGAAVDGPCERADMAWPGGDGDGWLAGAVTHARMRSRSRRNAHDQWHDRWYAFAMGVAALRALLLPVRVRSTATHTEAVALRSPASVRRSRMSLRGRDRNAVLTASVRPRAREQKRDLRAPVVAVRGHAPREARVMPSPPLTRKRKRDGDDGHDCHGCGIQ